MLTLWVIYFNPSDYPGMYVVRRWVVDTKGEQRGDRKPKIVTTSLALAREAIPPFLYNLGRKASDDRAILEVWV